MLNWLRNLIATPLVRIWEWFGKWLPPPPKPRIIPYDPNHFPTGPNLVKNGSFELGNFVGGSEMIVEGSGVITDWLVLQNGGKARWLTYQHSPLNKSADGVYFVDLTGGTAPSPGRVLAELVQSGALGFQPGKSYEFSIRLGVGPNNGPSANFGPPVKVTVRVKPGADTLEQSFVCNPVNPPTDTGVRWERFYFRFAIPATYVVATGNQTIAIIGITGERFIGVDTVSVRALT